ncbi:hypothetical protein COOONC_26391 [Cooperia oncophora]
MCRSTIQKHSFITWFSRLPFKTSTCLDVPCYIEDASAVDSRTGTDEQTRFVIGCSILFVALAARFILVLYSNIHDYMFHVNFTDIDYSVYSDAAKHVAAGRSPFERETYRWALTPLMVRFCLLGIAGSRAVL